MSKTWVSIEKPAEVWSHFLKNKDDSKDVKCKLCPTTFKNPSTDTGRYHLQSKHKMKMEPKTVSQEVKTLKTSNQPTIQSSFNTKSKETIELVLSRMVSLDDISFNRIENSVDIRAGLVARGFVVPKTRKTIKARISSFSDEKREEIK